jgi:hypothetical protein
MAPTMLHIDCGELAAAQYTLGICHPTGYPLFTLLGYLFLKIPLFARPIEQSNFLSALWTAGGLGIFTQLIFNILILEPNQSSKKNKETSPFKPIPPNQAFWISVSAMLLLGFNLTVWAQATSVEVYSLHIMVLSLVLTGLFHAWKNNTPQSWVLASCLLALGFTNHMTTLMILPLVGFLYFQKNGLNQKSFTQLILPALAGFGILILLYGFLFIRAGQQPNLNWGNIEDWTSFERHLTGHQYRTWIMAGSKVAARNLGKFLKAFPSEWAYFGPVLVVLGFRNAFRRNRILSWAFIIGIAFNIFYVIQYDIKDLEPYFLLALFGFGYFMAFGLLNVSEKIKNHALLPLLILFSASAMGINFRASDQSKTHFFEDYTRAVLNSVEPNALIMTQQWDFLITPYYYLKMAEGKYPQLMVMDKELMRRSWYVNGQVKLLDPNILKGAEPEVSDFLVKLKPFEENKPFEPNVIEEAYQTLLGKILVEQSRIRPVYLAMEYYRSQEFRVPKGYSLIPVGFLMKLVSEAQGKIYIPLKTISFQPVFPDNWGPKSLNAYYSKFIKDMWQLGFYTRAEYENYHQKAQEAINWRNAAPAD